MLSKLSLSALPLKCYKTCSRKMLLKTQFTSIPNLSKKSLKIFSLKKPKNNRMDLKPMKYNNAQIKLNFQIVLTILANKI